MGTDSLISPYGGVLVCPLVAQGREEALAHAKTLPSIQISDRAACDLEMLACGAFSPVGSFMGRRDYERVLHEMRLRDGTLFPMPITLPIPNGTRMPSTEEIALRDAHNVVLAIMRVEDVYEWNYAQACGAITGTNDPRHPLVAEMASWGSRNIAGTLRVLEPPQHYDFEDLRLQPSETRRALALKGRDKVFAFSTHRPLHRADEELTKRAAEGADATLLLHPIVGLTNTGDVRYYARVRTYKLLVDRYYGADRVVLALQPLAMRMAGPREALWHTLVARNYGASHFIIGSDPANPGFDSQGKPFYRPYEAQELVERYSDEHGVQVVPLGERASATPEVRMDCAGPGPAPAEWVTRPEVAEILSAAYPPPSSQGVCVWFTGLSGAGKSTTANALTCLLLESGRQVTVLDGDVVRTHLSRGLGFSKEDRDTNILRIGFVASEIVRHGGIAVCATVSPYRSTRDRVRELVGADQFIEVFVDAPLDVCEARDPKGMYSKARRGEVTGFTGIDDPYEAPLCPEIVLDSVSFNPSQNARRVLTLLAERGLVHLSI